MDFPADRIEAGNFRGVVNHRQIVAASVAQITSTGLWYLSVADSRRLDTPGGWPDLTIIGRRGVRFREVKAPGDIVRPMQRWVGNRLLAAGLDYAVWTEHDLIGGQVSDELGAIR